MTVVDAKRGKTCASESRLVLVLIGWRIGASFFKPFPSSLVPLFQNESKCETFHMKMCSACSFIFLQIKVIFRRKVSHLDSLWNRELRNWLFSSPKWKSLYFWLSNGKPDEDESWKNYGYSIVSTATLWDGLCSRHWSLASKSSFVIGCCYYGNITAVHSCVLSL